MKSESKKENLLKKLDKKRGSKNPIYKSLIGLRDWSSILKMRIQGNYGNKNVLPEYKAIYFNVPKVAQSSLGKVFREISEYKHLKYWDKEARKKYRDYFKFAFVRNPYDRILSLYFNKIQNPTADDFEAGIFVGFLKYHKFYPNMPFDEFVKAIHSISDKDADPHFRSQYYLLSDNKGNLIPDFVGKFENLREDYEKICEKLGIKSPPSLPHKKKSKREKNYRDYYDEQTKQLVAERYKKDFELFEYGFKK